MFYFSEGTGMELKYWKPIFWTSQWNFPTGSWSLPSRCVQKILENPENFMNPGPTTSAFSPRGEENRLTDNSSEIFTFHKMCKVRKHPFEFDYEWTAIKATTLEYHFWKFSFADMQKNQTLFPWTVISIFWINILIGRNWIVFSVQMVLIPQVDPI